jgi:hypothetical protein
MIVGNDPLADAWSDSARSPSTVIEDTSKAPISLFNTSVDQDAIMSTKASNDADDRYSHLPAVCTPKTLQAPFSIPPLFPFNRTSVYLLLSAESTAHRTPKSVILRGTSAHGKHHLKLSPHSLGLLTLFLIVYS